MMGYQLEMRKPQMPWAGAMSPHLHCLAVGTAAAAPSPKRHCRETFREGSPVWAGACTAARGHDYLPATVTSAKATNCCHFQSQILSVHFPSPLLSMSIFYLPLTKVNQKLARYRGWGKRFEVSHYRGTKQPTEGQDQCGTERQMANNLYNA